MNRDSSGGNPFWREEKTASFRRISQKILGDTEKPLFSS